MTQRRDEPFTPIENVRTSERVADAIRRTILSGRFRPGEVLPPERTLAARFDVTRNTVREALRVLEHARLVSIRHGSG
ncbi:MAG: FadR family transcriptional regulator, partial [Deltaproteobacteria bacterium]|nr:FadR family transcriptional regulator [Deltaproteobacteria bacterium]